MTVLVILVYHRALTCTPKRTRAKEDDVFVVRTLRFVAKTSRGERTFIRSHPLMPRCALECTQLLAATAVLAAIVVVAAVLTIFLLVAAVVLPEQ
jgi:hypothetical protein